MTVLLMLRSAAKESLRPQRQGYFGAQSHTPRNSCVRFAAGVTAGLAQHSPPGGSLRPTWAGLSPADCASLLDAPLPTLPTSNTCSDGESDGQGESFATNVCDRRRP